MPYEERLGLWSVIGLLYKTDLRPHYSFLQCFYLIARTWELGKATRKTLCLAAHCEMAGMLCSHFSHKLSVLLTIQRGIIQATSGWVLRYGIWCIVSAEEAKLVTSTFASSYDRQRNFQIHECTLRTYCNVFMHVFYRIYLFNASYNHCGLYGYFVFGCFFL